MQMTALLALLLAVECGMHYKVRRDPGLEVYGNVATGGEDTTLFRISAYGLNHCCEVHLDVLNAGFEPLTIHPRFAELSAEKCAPHVLYVAYDRGDNVSTFEELDEEAAARWRAAPVGTSWIQLLGPADSIEIAPHSFVSLDYYASGSWDPSCGAYSFKMKVGGVDVSATFPERG
jgi:hypothetical protein